MAGEGVYTTPLPLQAPESRAMVITAARAKRLSAGIRSLHQLARMRANVENGDTGGAVGSRNREQHLQRRIAYTVDRFNERR